MPPQSKKVTEPDPEKIPADEVETEATEPEVEETPEPEPTPDPEPEVETFTRDQVVRAWQEGREAGHHEAGSGWYYGGLVVNPYVVGEEAEDSPAE